MFFLQTAIQVVLDVHSLIVNGANLVNRLVNCTTSLAIVRSIIELTVVVASPYSSHWRVVQHMIEAHFVAHSDHGTFLIDVAWNLEGSVGVRSVDEVLEQILVSKDKTGQEVLLFYHLKPYVI